MNIVFWKCLGRDPQTHELSFVKQEFSPEDLHLINIIQEAANKAERMAPVFVDAIYVVDIHYRDTNGSYGPIKYYKTARSIGIEKPMFKELGRLFSVDDLICFFLHEIAHHIENTSPGTIGRFLSRDEAWNETLQKYPGLERKSWIEEVQADIFAVKSVGMAFISALIKLTSHIQDHKGISDYPLLDTFSETERYPDIFTRRAIINDYVEQQEIIAKRSFVRMPFRTLRSEMAYQTTQSTTDDDNERRHYFERIAISRIGYDFLQTLLMRHPLVNLSLKRMTIKPVKIDDKSRRTEIAQFIHDITTLMKLLLGSANLYINGEGAYCPNNLPYGAVRAMRGSITQTALPKNGSIQRIFDECGRMGLYDYVLNDIKYDLKSLHACLEYASNEKMFETTTNAADAKGLPSARKSNRHK